jgi:sugar transferase (PEP-CTERM/EpsH1 system associated)
MAAIHRREGRLLAGFERSVAAKADVSLFVSEAEAGLFRRKVRLDRADIRAVQNGVDLSYYDPAADFPRLPSEGPLIAFTGQMDYAPNVDAVNYFAAEVLPHIPEAHFAIVGRRPTSAVKRLAALDRVTVTGAVEDVRTWLAAADVVVAPLRIARGVQNKVLEAMAMGRPVVTSPAAFEGIDAVDGRDLVVADGPAEEARAIQTLLADPVCAANMGKAARRRMEEAYRWETRLRPLAEIVGLPARRVAA